MTVWLAGFLVAALWAPCSATAREGLANASIRAGDVVSAAAAVRDRCAANAIKPEKGRLLVASRSLADPNFSEAVVLLLGYSAGGAMGVIINRPTDVRVTAALPDVKVLRDRPDRVYLGGPVAANLMLILIRSTTHLKSSELIFGDVYATGSASDLQKALGAAGKGNRLRAYVGHAGWGAGQLEDEIARGDWYVTAADATTVFDTPPAAIWSKLIDRLSGDWARLPGADTGS